LLLAAATVATLLAAMLALRGLLPDRREPSVAAWERLCRKLARAGLARSPSEGPTAYARRVAGSRPDLAQPVRDAADAYVRLRYQAPDPHHPAPVLLGDLLRRVRRFKT
jgi:hypothetical protein